VVALGLFLYRAPLSGAVTLAVVLLLTLFAGRKTVDGPARKRNSRPARPSPRPLYLDATRFRGAGGLTKPKARGPELSRQ
jgi:hypothetical protein